MRLIRSIASLEDLQPAEGRAVAIGVFDGLHKGHQSIIQSTLAGSRASGGPATVMTFEPMPREFFSPDDPPPRLTRFRERFELLAEQGIDELFCPRFASVHTLPADVFIRALLVEGLNASVVVIGDDFRFGARRTGDVRGLIEAGERFGFRVEVVPPVEWHGVRISSTAIRERLGRGDLAGAREMLGRDYAISGRVVRGLGLGKDLGFPTANVNLKRRLAAVDGIFAVRVSGIGKTLLDGVASIGTRPTVGGGEPLLEVYIFDFNRDIYGSHITVHFVSRLREERKFEDIKTMKEQMHRDVAAARAALAAQMP